VCQSLPGVSSGSEFASCAGNHATARAYLNGEDANQVDFQSYRWNPASADIARMAFARYQSDRIKTESGAVLKQVAEGLQKNPSLKLEIDG